MKKAPSNTKLYHLSHTISKLSEIIYVDERLDLRCTEQKIDNSQYQPLLQVSHQTAGKTLDNLKNNIGFMM